MAKDYIEIQRDLGGGEKEGCRSGVMIICSLRMYVCMCVCGCMAKESMKNWEACMCQHSCVGNPAHTCFVLLSHAGHHPQDMIQLCASCVQEKGF